MSLNLTADRQCRVQHTTIYIRLQPDCGRFRQIVRQVKGYAPSNIAGG